MSEQDYRNYSPPGSDSKSNDSAIGAMFKVGFILVGCLLLTVMFDSCGGSDNEPVATPAPPVVVENNDVELVQALGEILQPVVDASANAQRHDTSAAHPPSTFDTWGATLTALCVVGMVVAGVVVVVVVWIVTRAGLLARFVQELEKRGG